MWLNVSFSCTSVEREELVILSISQSGLFRCILRRSVQLEGGWLCISGTLTSLGADHLVHSFYTLVFLLPRDCWTLHCYFGWTDTVRCPDFIFIPFLRCYFRRNFIIHCLCAESASNKFKVTTNKVVETKRNGRLSRSRWATQRERCPTSSIFHLHVSLCLPCSVTAKTPPTPPHLPSTYSQLDHLILLRAQVAFVSSSSRLFISTKTSSCSWLWPFDSTQLVSFPQFLAFLLI